MRERDRKNRSDEASMGAGVQLREISMEMCNDFAITQPRILSDLFQFFLRLGTACLPKTTILHPFNIVRILRVDQSLQGCALSRYCYSSKLENCGYLLGLTTVIDVQLFCEGGFVMSLAMTLARKNRNFRRLRSNISVSIDAAVPLLRLFRTRSFLPHDNKSVSGFRL